MGVVVGGVFFGVGGGGGGLVELRWQQIWGNCCFLGDGLWGFLFFMGGREVEGG